MAKSQDNHIHSNILNSFNPISHPSAHVLILGSMPGVLSLKANHYYAHPRNAFWRILAGTYNFNVEIPYEDRIEILKISGVALWDVLYSCIRPGSLDSAIENGSRIANDFQTFFQQHANIKLVIFNGAEAEKSFNAYVMPNLNVSEIRFVRLPSTSPAHAGVSIEQKTAIWRLALLMPDQI